MSSTTTGYNLRKRSREMRNKMARMARAMNEDGDDDLSESSFSPAEKRPRSHVRASATKRETRNKMARMARAMYEDGDDDDDLSESSFSPAEKRPRSHVRASATKRETRNKMARMARAMYEDGDDDDDLSESSFSPAEKRPRSHVRASATKRERARRHKLNKAYDKLRRVVPKLTCDARNEGLTKIATLRLAIDYIAMLTNYLDGKMENEAFSQSSTENSADEDTASSIEDNDSNILAKLIDSVVDEFGWFLDNYQ